MTQHLDELTLTLIADGEETPSEASAHAAVCPTCAARVEAIRADSLVLGASLAIDADDLAFLFAAALPDALVAQAAADSRLARRERLSGLFWSIVPLALGYAGWVFLAPILWGWLAILRQAGGTALVLRAAAEVTLRAVDSFASIVESASAVPGFNAPLLSLSLIAALTYAALLLLPGRGEAGQNQAAA